MLVLSRKIGERVHVGNNIVLTVTRIDGGRIQLGVEAPADVPIVRQELVSVSESVELGSPTCGSH